MNNKLKIIMLITFALLIPIFYLNNSRIYILEVVSLVLLFINYNNKVIHVDRISKTYNYYLLFYLVSWVISIILSNHYENQTLYQFRMVLLTSITGIVLSTYFKNITIKEMENIIFVIYIIFFIPGLIAIFQFTDFLNIRNITKSLYDPQILVLNHITMEDLISERAPSIFKDYFTGSMFYMSTMCGAVYFYIKVERMRIKILMGLYIILTLISTVITSRTSLYFGILSIIILPWLLGVQKKKITLFYISILLTLLIAYLTLLKSENIYKYTWAFELLLTGDSVSWSGSQYMMDGFLRYFTNHFEILFIPLNLPLFYEKYYYSDNFYFQEIVRNGIYGILAILMFVFTFLRYSYRKRNWFIAFVVLLFSIINWKGGNTFFVERSSIIIIFILIAVNKYHESINEQKSIANCR